MTAPDSPAAAVVREMAATLRREGNEWGLIREREQADALDAVLLELAELAEARCQPRVWLEGDEVPAEVTVMTEIGVVVGPAAGPWRTRFDVIEAPLAQAAAAVAAERERRAKRALAAEVTS